jgi:hypothetical protein
VPQAALYLSLIVVMTIEASGNAAARASTRDGLECRTGFRSARYGAGLQ